MTPSNTYERVRTTDLDGRELEASVLLRAVKKLTWCAQNWERSASPEFRDRLQDALSFTQRIWTFLQVEVANPEHHLPRSVRQSVFRLGRYSDQTITKLYAGGTLRQLQSLIALNREIAAGLSDKKDRDPVVAEAPSSAMPSAGHWG
jgi:flagellar protein FlaF